MGLRSILDTSMFKESTYSKTLEGRYAPYKITIADYYTPETLFMTGVLKGGINFSMDSTWSDLSLGNIVNNFSTLEKIVNIINYPLAVEGVSYDNAGVMTEKFFSKGGYLEIEPTFEVVNWNGDGMPIKAAMFLLNYCVPQRAGEQYTIKDVMGEFVPFGKKLSDAVTNKTVLEKFQGFFSEAVSNTAQEFSDAIGTVFGDSEGKGLIPNAGQNIRSGIGKLSQKQIVKTKSPSTVDVSISNYFRIPNMVVESLNVEFSDKITDTGPIKAEFKVRLSTKTMPTIGDMGLRIKSQRVFNESTLNTAG
jgi:hypothetical protein